MVEEKSRDFAKTWWAQHCSTAIWLDIREQRDHKQGLLWRIQEMGKEVAVNVPTVQILSINNLSFSFWSSKIYDQIVIPRVAPLFDAVLSQEVTDDMPDH